MVRADAALAVAEVGAHFVALWHPPLRHPACYDVHLNLGLAMALRQCWVSVLRRPLPHHAGAEGGGLCAVGEDGGHVAVALPESSDLGVTPLRDDDGVAAA